MKRAAQQTGRRPCWSPRSEGAERYEAAARQGSGERHVQGMPESGRRDPPDFSVFRVHAEISQSNPSCFSRNKSFCIVKRDPGSEGRAADVLAPAPGQGEGWGGGRNLAGAVPAFDPHPSLPPARGKVQFPHA